MYCLISALSMKARSLSESQYLNTILLYKMKTTNRASNIGRCDDQNIGILFQLINLCEKSIYNLREQTIEVRREERRRKE